jgi:hypothetical protein
MRQLQNRTWRGFAAIKFSRFELERERTLQKNKVYLFSVISAFLPQSHKGHKEN